MLNRRRAVFFFLTLVFCAPASRLRAADGDDMSAAAAMRYQTGLAYERLGRLEESYPELQLACNLAPDNSQMSLALGIVACRLARYDEGRRALEHSIALDASSTASYYQLALLYETKGLADRAIESWQRFLQLSQDALLKDEAEKHIRYLQGGR